MGTGLEAGVGWWTVVPFAVSLLVFGLPHGAVDHIAAVRLLGWGRPGLGGWVVVILGYLAVAGAGVALWYADARVAFAAFIALTWYHWGQGELEAARRWRPGWLGGRWHRAAYLAWRGSQPMVLPLVFSAEIYGVVAEACTELFGVADPEFLAWIRGTGVLAGLLSAGLWVCEKILAPSATRWAIDKLALDGVLAALFLFVHPVFAVGLYFLCWHSPHHMNRLRHFFGGTCGGRDGCGVWTWRRLILAAAPLTIATCAGLVLIGWGAMGRGISAVGLLGVYLVGLACLTWPHAILVSAEDAKEKIWETP